jgi:hypothetical protein
MLFSIHVLDGLRSDFPAPGGFLLLSSFPFSALGKPVAGAGN